MDACGFPQICETASAGPLAAALSSSPRLTSTALGAGTGAVLGAFVGLAIAMFAHRRWVLVSVGTGAAIVGYYGYRMGDDLNGWLRGDEN